MDIYKRIKQDHEKHRELLDKISDTTGDSEERKKLFKKLREDVEAHANAEEETFYSKLIAKKMGRDQAQHSIVEHHEAEELFQELEEMDMSSSGWLNKFNKLKEELEHHMKEEEEDVFAISKKVISEDKAEELTGDFEDMKETELKDIRKSA